MIRCLALALPLAAAPAIAEVVPLAHGTYVEQGTPCADPPLVALRRYDGTGFLGPHDRACEARIVARRDADVVMENSCVAIGASPAQRSSERVTLHLSGRDRFTDLTSGLDYRLCPTGALPQALRRRTR